MAVAASEASGYQLLEPCWRAAEIPIANAQ